MLAAMLGAALCCATPSYAQIRRPAQRAAKKAIIQRAAARRAEDFIMQLVEQPPDKRRETLAGNPRFQNLPRMQRQRILTRLEQIDQMKPEERAQLIERYHLFSRLDPAKRERARELYRQWITIPGPKRQMMTRAVARLRRLDPEQRPAALASSAFTERFDDRERELIGEIASIAPGAPEPDEQ